MIKLIVGVGNPGIEYELTRHNVAWIFLDTWDKLSTSSWQSKFKGQYSSFSHKGEKVYTLKPETFMNLSGESVGPMCKFFKIKPEEVLVIHDEVDLPFGQVQMKKGGGLAGHNGLKSISQHLGTQDFYRLRIGVDKPKRGSVASWVLGKFPVEDTADLEKVLNASAKCLDVFLTSGFNKAALLINKKNILGDS